MKVRNYIREHRSTIKKVVVIGVPTTAGVVLGCRFGVIPYRRIAGTAVRVGKKVPVRAIGTKAKDGAVLLLDSKIAHDVGKGIKREFKKDTRRFVGRKLRENRNRKVKKRTLTNEAKG